MSQEICPTVTVMRGDARVVINESDYDPERDGEVVTDLTSSSTPAEPVTDLTSPPTPDAHTGEKTVEKGARGKFYVKQDGQTVSKGFDTEADAWASLMPGGSAV